MPLRRLRVQADVVRLAACIAPHASAPVPILNHSGRAMVIGRVTAEQELTKPLAPALAPPWPQVRPEQEICVSRMPPASAASDAVVETARCDDGDFTRRSWGPQS